MALYPWEKRLWLARAPAGVWSHGPIVIYEIPGEPTDTRAEYERMNYSIVGPYVLDEEAQD